MCAGRSHCWWPSRWHPARFRPPLVLVLVTAVRRNPIPYLLAVATASRGVEIGFWANFRVGAPLSLMTIVIGLLLL